MIDWTKGLLLTLGITGLLLTLSGCSTTPVDENDPASLFRDAEDDIKSDHFQIAIEKLRTIKNRFPYSKYAVDAQLRIGDIYFLQESYPEAAATYETFKDLHPKHEKAPYAMFRVGKSYLLDSPGNVARDLAPVTKALAAYQEFIKRYPQAPEVEQAQKDILQLRSQLAQKELYIGDFYYKRDFLDSARPRYQKVVELFPETEAAQKAQEKLAKIESKKKTEETPESQER